MGTSMEKKDFKFPKKICKRLDLSLSTEKEGSKGTTSFPRGFDEHQDNEEEAEETEWPSVKETAERVQNKRIKKLTRFGNKESQQMRKRKMRRLKHRSGRKRISGSNRRIMMQYCKPVVQVLWHQMMEIISRTFSRS